jgi:hypothetical protein
MWELRRLTTVWISTAYYRDSFTKLTQAITHLTYWGRARFESWAGHRLSWQRSVSSPAIWSRVVHWKTSDVSEEYIVYTFRVEEYAEKGKGMKLTPRKACKDLLVVYFMLASCLTYSSTWRWRRHVLPKRRLTFIGLHDVASTKNLKCYIPWIRIFFLSFLSPFRQIPRQ